MKKELSDGARSLVLKLLKLPYNQISTKLLLAQAKGSYPWQRFPCSPLSALHCASLFGMVEAVAALIEMGCYDVNEGDFTGCTPLSWASRNGHGEVIEALLGREEVNPDKPDDDGQALLSYAAREDVREW